MSGPSYGDAHAFGALLAAFHRARRAKRGKGGEPAFYRDLEANLLELSEALRERRWRPDPYRFFVVRHTKERLVAEASFRDRVVHHALVGALEPAFEARFVSSSYACRKGKGVHAALERARRLAQRHRYFLRLDVQSYFASIDHQTLLRLIEQVVSDEGILWLCGAILDGAREPGGLRRGLPIGNLTSQFWANVYLDPIDHHALERRGVGTYTRYMDDMLALASDKPSLWRLAAEVRAMARDELGLTLKESVTQVAPVTEGIPWLGFRVFPGVVRIQREGRRRFGRKVAASVARAATGDLEEADEAGRAASLCAHMAQGDTLDLRRSILQRLDVQPGAAAR